jgi:Ion channel
MTTVGYGDYSPDTIAGRILTVTLAFCGNFTTSLFVVSLTNLLQFFAAEKRSYSLLTRLQEKDQQQVFGARIVATSYKKLLVMKSATSISQIKARKR